jgi:hypothetical protein
MDISMTVVFEDTYQLLSAKQQKIWNVIHHFCRTYRNAFPSHAKIAELAGCSIRTVFTAINNFRNFGWLETTKRCFRSCLYFIKEQLLFINPKDKRNYLKQKGKYDDGDGGGNQTHSSDKLQQKLQHSKSISLDTKTMSDSALQKEKKYYKPNKIIPEFIKIKGMPEADWQKLANQFSDRDLYEALQEAKSFSKNIAKITNIAAWITSKCKKYILKRSKKNEPN